MTSADPPLENQHNLLLGYEVGADYHLANYDRSIEYLRALEQASPRIKLFEVGKTTEGTPQYYAVITSEESMAKLDHFSGG